MSTKDLWLSVLKRLMPTIQKAQFITWFQSTVLVEIKEDGTAIVGVPTVFAMNWISSKYQVKLLQALKELMLLLRMLNMKFWVN